MYNFMKGIKATMTHDLFSIPSSGNCEADDSQFLDLILNWQSDDPIATTSDLILKKQWLTVCHLLK